MLREDELLAIRGKLAEATPKAVGYRLMVQPIPADKGMEAAEAAEFETLSKSGFEVKTNNQESKETHGSDLGVVIDVGGDSYSIGNLAKVEPWANVGDVVIFPRYCGHICEVPPGSGNKIHFMTDDDLLGKYEGVSNG